MEVKIRNAEYSDIQEISRIHVDSWKSAFDGLMPSDYINGYTVSSRMIEWHSTIRNGSDVVVVADMGGKIVGFMSYLSHPENAETIELSKLYLCPSVYGQKLGSTFVNHLEAYSLQKGINVIRLYVLDKNEAAIQFYSKHGFKFSDSYVSEEFEGTIIIDLLMTKRISD